MIRPFFTFLVVALSSVITYAQKVRVAVAANAQFVSEALQVAFEQETGIELELIVSSSGKLTAQIEQGAPFDVFLSADMKYPEALYKKGLTEAKPKIYAYGSLVLWTVREDLDLSPDLQMLANEAVQKVAVANPQTAPYGEAAIKALNNYGVYRPVQDKLVYGESIAQVNQYILSGAADLGFTAKSVVMEPSMKEKGKWIELDTKFCPPIAQGAVMLKAIRKQTYQQAHKFYTFLFGKTAKGIFTQYGYNVAENRP